MKLIEKLRGPALVAANARIKELEERLEEAKKEAQDGWDRFFVANTEKSELKYKFEKAKGDLERMRIEKAKLNDELEKAQSASQRKREMLNQGRHCNTCKHQTETGRFAKNGRPITGCNKQACEGYEARE